MSDNNAVILNDRYEMQQRIGRGGMADVYLARDILLDRLVAIKVLFPEYATDPAFVERFRREAQSAANLNHPNIVSVYDWGRSNNTYFMAMEYVPGRTLAEALHDVGQITAMKAAEVGIEVAAALSFAHRGNVVHRDIKPGNILIGSNGQLKVADFGIARALGSAADSNLTQVGAVMGTAAYLSPEQAQGGQPDPRSDLYSLGIVLYEMVGGRVPFSGDNPVSIAYKQVHEAPLPLNQLASDVPRAFEAIVARLLAKDPDLRYATAEAVRDDLRRFRDGIPVQALADAINRRNGDPTPIGTAAPTTVITTGPMVGGTDDLAAATTVIPSAQATTALPRTTINANPDMPPGYTASNAVVPTDDLQRKRTAMVFGAISATVLLIIGAVVAFLALSGGSTNAPTVAVPDVTNQVLEDAVTTLKNLGFEVVPVAEETTTVDTNVVWKQVPLPGEEIKEGETVTIVYNPSNAPMAVPNLAGMTIDQARAALLNLGLTIGVITPQNDPTAPADTIIASVPKAGEQVLGGATIDLTVSQGSGVVQIPNVQGQTSQAARSVLEGEPYKFLITVVEEASATVESSRVTRTSPTIGADTTKGASVTIYVSTGQATVAVPLVSGLTEAQARAKLTSSGFIVKVEYIEVATGNANDGRVIAQDPSMNVQSTPGSQVLLKVGKAIAATTTVAPTTTVPATTIAPVTTAPATTIAPVTTTPATTIAPVTTAPATTTPATTTPATP
jgi:serine/threonine-protein kinase